jgi:hypothetical protein
LLARHSFTLPCSESIGTAPARFGASRPFRICKNFSNRTTNDEVTGFRSVDTLENGEHATQRFPLFHFRVCRRRPCIVVAEYRCPECSSDFAIRKGVDWAGEKCIKNDRKLQALRRVENVGQRLTLSKCESPSTVGNLQRVWGLGRGEPPPQVRKIFSE